MASQDKKTKQKQESEKVPTHPPEGTTDRGVSPTSSPSTSQPYSTAKSHAQQEASPIFFPPSPLQTPLLQDPGHSHGIPRHLPPPLPVAPSSPPLRKDSKTTSR